MLMRNRARDPGVSYEDLHRLLVYDPDTGVLLWRVRRSQRVRAGDEAGGLSPNRGGKLYRRVKVGGKHVFAHRIVWKMMTGEWPEGEIDHIDGDGTNNRWSNLRLADRELNCAHLVGIKSNNTSGHTGVHYHRGSGRWLAYMKRRGGHVLYSYHETREGAAQARREAERRFPIGTQND